MKFNKELSKRIYKQHCLGCKIAIAVNIIWAISNYFIIESNRWTYVIINLAVAALILVAIKSHKHIKISAETLGLIPMIATITAFAYTYNTVDLDAFQKITFPYLAVFIGAALFLLWEIKYSFISVAYTVVINGVFYSIYSPIKIEDYLTKGSILVLTVALFMIISIQSRYILVRKELKSRRDLDRSEKRLIKSEQQHRLLFMKNPTPMMICNLDTLKIIAVNDLVVSKYGYSKNEFKTMSVLDLHREKDYKDVLDCADNSKSGKDKISKWIHILKDGTEINVELIAKSIEFDDTTSRLISVNDITEVKLYQNELIKAKQIAEKSKKLQSQFLSSMSHEIRTPMNGILGISRVLKGTKMDEEQKKFTTAIITSAENLMIIINDILDFSKIEAGKVEIELSKFNLETKLLELQELFTLQALEKNISLNFSIDKTIPNLIIGDAVRLNQILINLIGNAIKFTKKGMVKLEVKSKLTSDNHVRLQFNIIDTGIGIPADKIDTIFESFTQASSSTTKEYGGTGLGLTISKQLVELQGGMMKIESTFGKGSTFSFDINFKIYKDSETTNKIFESHYNNQDEKLHSKLNGKKILLVEDHPINQMLAIKVLEDWGFKVSLAENGKIALEKVKNQQYDLILMDLSMPVMDGYEATKNIRSGQYSLNTNTPIIAMTASAFISENKKCITYGMNDYISKPFNPKELLKKISNQISNYLKPA